MAAAGVVLAVICLAFPAHRMMPHASLSLLFLTGVLIVAARTGPGPSLLASTLSFLAYNFFFTPPYHTFEVADDGDVATLVFFLLMAAICGNLAARMRREMARRQSSLQRISNLYEFGRRMSSAAGTEAVLEALAGHLAHLLDRPVAVLLANSGGIPTIQATSGPPQTLHPAVIEAAWSRLSAEPGLLDSWHFLKLVANGEPMGMAAIHGELDSERIDLVRSLCDQAAIALDRTRLVADLEQAWLVSETEQLRSALLSSVSHDLRTPLASIIGATTSLLEYGDSFTAENRRELLTTALEEAQRLDRHIQNLLDMTRLGHGSLNLVRDWVDLHDIVAGAMERLRDTLKGLQVDIDFPAMLPLLRVQGSLIEQALFNLLDNAIRFSPAAGRITLVARAVGDNVELELCDEGPGIDPGEREKIFAMFYTVNQGDRWPQHGAGLGLAICRGIVAAHGGKVTAHAGRNGRGTCMRISLPVTRPDESSGA